MREGWKEILLSDHCYFLNGGSWSDKEYVEAGIPVIKVTNMVDGGISFNSLDHIPESSRKKYEKHILKKGDLVVATVGSHPTQPNSVVGRTSMIPARGDNHLLNQNAVCVRVFNDNMGLHPLFLFYLTQTTHFKHYAATRAKGSANQVRLAISELKKYTFPAPPLPLQTRIADLLSAYDELIEVNNRRIALLEQTAEQLYKEWFVRLRFPGYAQTKVRKGVPEGWEVKKLSEITTIVMGQSPKSEFYNTEGKGLPFHQGVGSFGAFFPKHETFCSVDGRTAYPGDILFSVRAPVGRMNVTDKKVTIGRGLCAMRSNQGQNWWLYSALNVAFANEDIIGNGAIFNSVSKKELHDFKLLFPERNLITSYESLAKPIFDQITNLHTQNQTLRRTRDLLLPRLISGQLSVAEAETALNA